MKNIHVYNSNHKNHHFQHDGIYCCAIKDMFFGDQLQYNKIAHSKKKKREKISQQ